MKESNHIFICRDQCIADALVKLKNVDANMGFLCLKFRENPDAS